MSLKYVNGKTMIENKKNSLDQYFTKKEVAQQLINKTYEIISSYEDISKYLWIEPSCGDGSFFDLIPSKNKIGIDIDPKIDGIIKSDYLKFQLPTRPFIVIGNPPFGHRGVKALEFINYSKNADFVCFILPMFFDSSGKGSAKHRVKNLNLIYSQELPSDSFYTLDSKVASIKCVFQIWSKNYNNHHLQSFNWYKLKNKNPFKKYLDIFTVSTAKNRECGKKWIFEEKADYYISSTFYKNNKIVYDFKDVKYGSGLAIKINTTKEDEILKIKSLLESTDWNIYSSAATNSCRHIGKSHIYTLLFDNNFLEVNDDD